MEQILARNRVLACTTLGHVVLISKMDAYIEGVALIIGWHDKPPFILRRWNMDLYAYALSNDSDIHDYIIKHYGNVPRLRGVRFMKIYDTKEFDNGDWSDMFLSYCGQDVVYIHTRCGDCGMGFDDEDSNYVYCGGKEWEEQHKDLFLSHETDDDDCTYCSHYFKAIVDEEYKAILNKLVFKGQGNDGA